MGALQCPLCRCGRRGGGLADGSTDGLTDGRPDGDGLRGTATARRRGAASSHAPRQGPAPTGASLVLAIMVMMRVCLIRYSS